MQQPILRPLKQFSFLLYATPLLIGIAAATCSFFSYTTHHELKTAEEERFSASQLSTHLRQSTDNLSMMARAYVVTGETHYRDHFETILLIRDGRHPRPVHYNRAYWDLIIAPKDHNPIFEGEPKAFQQLLLEAGFPPEEMALLSQAQKASDNLALIENEAFQALEGIFKDAQGHYNLHQAPNPSYAVERLFDNDYLQAKAEIMTFINRFDQLQFERTQTRVEELFEKNEFYTSAALISYLLLFSSIIVITLRRRDEQQRARRNLEQEVEHQTHRLSEQNLELNGLIEHLNTARTQLVEAEKMSALGRMVAGFAHEINTPIGISVTAASGIVQQTQKTIKQQKEKSLSREQFSAALEHIELSSEMILKNLQRTDELVSRFKQVSVDQSISQRRTISLHDYLAEVICTISPRFKRQGIEISNQIPEQVTLYVNPGLIAQIITNLIVNASIHAFDENGGRIDLSCQQTESHITLNFTDNGRGMSAEVLEHLYDPFFTTKRDQGGTGLGMHIVHNLVTQQLGGCLRCESRLGAGTCFQITLPRTSASPTSDTEQ